MYLQRVVLCDFSKTEKPCVPPPPIILSLLLSSSLIFFSSFMSLCVHVQILSWFLVSVFETKRKGKNPSRERKRHWSQVLTLRQLSAQCLILQTSKAQGSKAFPEAPPHWLSFTSWDLTTLSLPLSMLFLTTRKPHHQCPAWKPSSQSLSYSSNFASCKKSCWRPSMVYQYPICFLLGSYHNL